MEKIYCENCDFNTVESGENFCHQINGDNRNNNCLVYSGNKDKIPILNKDGSPFGYHYYAQFKPLYPPCMALIKNCIGRFCLYWEEFHVQLNNCGKCNFFDCEIELNDTGNKII